MPKTCTKCGLEKDDAKFQYGKITRTECRDCHNQWRREAAKKHKETADKVKKTCAVCNVEKLGCDFAYSSKICKPCKSEKDKESNHRPAADAPPKSCNKCNTEQPATQFRYQSKVCLTCERKQLYEWRKENPDKFKGNCKKYREKEDYREKQNKYKRVRYNTEMEYKLQNIYRNRIRMFIKGGLKKGHEKYTEMLGCSLSTVIEWLESNFVAGMTWENYGKVWHIDHTMPCSVFDFKEIESVKACFNWSNLAPMFGEENLSKSDKINMTLVQTMKEKARAFITTHRDKILTESLPIDLRHDFGVLDTKVLPKGGAGE